MEQSGHSPLFFLPPLVQRGKERSVCCCVSVGVLLDLPCLWPLMLVGKPFVKLPSVPWAGLVLGYYGCFAFLHSLASGYHVLLQCGFSGSSVFLSEIIPALAGLVQEIHSTGRMYERE